MDTQRLQGKVIVITGAASGIGRACAERYAAEGGRVVLADINAAAGEAVTAGIRDRGGQAVFQHTDVSETAHLDRLLARALSEYGDVHVWHNNAFRSVFKNIIDQTLQEFDDTVRISLRAYWYGSKIAVTHMDAHSGGVILNTASVQSYFGEPGFSAYQVAKGGILSLTRSIGVDHAPKVRAVAIAPGFIVTPAHDGIPADTIARVKASIPAGRGAQPEEVAALAAYLASDEADYITGTGIIMDGGYLGI
jgi:meso-butanediol dehydrogenase / (S,S)-butanediol dehydrogenase / diacetyl reductase